jgi:hypothetical protein
LPLKKQDLMMYERKKRYQAKWLTGRDPSLITKDHPSQGFGSHPDPKKSRAPKNTIANHKSSPGVKKRKLPSMGAGHISWKSGIGKCCRVRNASSRYFTQR